MDLHRARACRQARIAIHLPVVHSYTRHFIDSLQHPFSTSSLVKRIHVPPAVQQAPNQHANDPSRGRWNMPCLVPSLSIPVLALTLGSHIHNSSCRAADCM